MVSVRSAFITTNGSVPPAVAGGSLSLCDLLAISKRYPPATAGGTDSMLSASESPKREGEEDALEKAARKEREYVKARLHEELKREPTEDEVNEWLREQTEGY
ncbi:MAG: hypothetical protein AUG51_11205 [Acidobacteria bacterium 13_1_20CM_3_53_8]|nr:MAG: hypothetical protein AUG51_11205 [Acidobacteria bacterium 13_1_20CM_3_53_8]